MKIAIITLTFISLFFSSQAQQVFDKHYTFNNWTVGMQVLEIPGQGYFIAGLNDSLAFDSNNQPVADFIEGIIVKLDYNGDTIKTFRIGNSDTTFYQQYGVNSSDFFRSIMIADDGNIIVAGETQSYNADNIYDVDLWILKFNTNLDTLWTKLYSIPDSQLAINAGQGAKIHDGGIVLPGSQNYLGNPNSQFRIAAFDSAGNLKFNSQVLKQYHGAFYGAVETSDHGFIGSGTLYNSIANEDYSPIVIKMDSVGNSQWYSILPFSGDLHFANNITRTLDGNYIFNWANVVHQPGAAHKVWMLHATKIDELGNQIWTKEYGYTFDYYERIKELPNGNFMIAGFFNDTLGTGRQAFLMLCDSNGDSLWTRKFSGAPGTSPGSVPDCWDGTYTSDGGYILTGTTYCCNFTPQLGWTSSLWVLKTDSLGLITSVINLPKPSLNLALLSSAFPNPTNNFTTISSIIPPNTKNAFLILFDANGRQLEQVKTVEGFNQTIFDLSKYTTGEYVIALSIDGFNAGTKKIIKH